MARLKILLLVIFCCGGFAFADSIAFSPSHLPDSTSKVREVMISLYGIDPVENPEDVDILDESEIMTAVNIAAMRDVPIAMSDSSSTKPMTHPISKVDSIMEVYRRIDGIRAEVTKSQGNIISHEVQKGESMESITAKYGVSVKDIHAFNPYSDCYAGVILDIPVKLPMSEVDENIKISENSAYYAGQLYLNRGDYKKSIECYSRVIKEGNAALVAYYNRGVAWYNSGKLKQAMNDLQHVIKMDFSGKFPEAQSLYDSAYTMQIQRDEENAQAWGEFIGTLATTAATVYAASQYNKQQSRSVSNSGSDMLSSNSSSAGDDNDNENYTSKSATKKPGKCGLCAGKGYLVEYAADFGIKEYEYCDECGKNMQTTHWHKSCPGCHGSGTK